MLRALKGQVFKRNPELFQMHTENLIVAVQHILCADVHRKLHGAHGVRLLFGQFQNVLFNGSICSQQILIELRRLFDWCAYGAKIRLVEIVMIGSGIRGDL